ncbi:integrase recombinase [Lactiplantibacillus fabifermentans DSM 21115]|uniref:Integrase recombinase n=1 Tax=Lactiplantibacillus fabifermentans DSM 21115 TaxID=1413187 RepID=A0A0R2NIP6_9LACO|nr:integrase recombinase [Lactiplantibacillus fabifermentans DSM 21115]
MQSTTIIQATETNSDEGKPCNVYYNVEPLRTAAEINDFLAAVGRGRYGDRNRMIVLVGINTGLRMSDILSLTVDQVRGHDRALIIEKKTHKKRWVYLKNLRPALETYTAEMTTGAPLFVSARGQQAITVNGVYHAFQQAGELLGRQDIGTHTLRKTFGYHYYQQTHDIAGLMMIFNHANEAVTKRYIGIERDTLERSLDQFQLGLG